MTPIPHVLISNDDGVNAPGLAALAITLAACPELHVSICGPAEEQSAKSHALTLHPVCVATRIPKIHSAVLDAYAVSGTPADSVMLALSSNILSCPAVDLVVSGINRGENCGLHICYSGTVGAAREAAINGIPALAISLDSYAARAPEQYMEAARCALPLVKAMLGLTPLPRSVALATRGYVLNINAPGEGVYKGYAWARQGTSCSFSRFVERARDATMEPSAASNAQQLDEVLQVEGVREFTRELAFRQDGADGTDLAVVKRGWVSVTPLRVIQDISELSQQDAAARGAYAAVVAAAAKLAGVECQGVPHA